MTRLGVLLGLALAFVGGVLVGRGTAPLPHRDCVEVALAAPGLVLVYHWDAAGGDPVVLSRSLDDPISTLWDY